MALISRLSVRIVTADLHNAGTDGNVYLGICGREDSDEDDFERGSDRTYAVTSFNPNPGETRIKKPADNNPLSPYQLNTDRLDKFPVYIRFDPKDGGDQWIVEDVIVTVPSNGSTITYLGQPGNLKLGTSCGKWMYLRKSAQSTRQSGKQSGKPTTKQIRRSKEHRKLR